MVRKLIIFLVIVVAIGLIARNVDRESVEEVFTGPRVKVGDTVFLVDIADAPEERAQGLAGRPSLRSDQAMLFIFDRPDLYGFWMKGMFFPIDIIWIKDNQVIGFEEELDPDSSPNPKLYYPPALVDRVLEVKAGAVRERQIQIGQVVEIRL